ncbi:multicopper oxidase family protein [Streptomyces mirabilis]|uniref:multicopper oxidase family protein n=1 Tax=Streptomyces mirabilis TaxID=68239 RepID=UPI003828B13F
MIERRKFLMAGGLGAAAMLPRGVPGTRAYSATAHPPAGCEDPSGTPNTPPLQKFVDPLPMPMTAIADPSVYPGADYYEVTMRQGSWQFHRDLEPSLAWGYWATNPHDPHRPIGMGYLGPTLSVTRDHPTVVKWRNELPTTHMFQHVIDMIREKKPVVAPIPPPPYKYVPQFPDDINVWNVVHQHGGYTAPQSDGQPLQAFSPKGFHAEGYTTLDPSRVKPNEAIYGYTNHDHSCMLWYHDHAMGMSALNVYAGLAGLYLINEPADKRLGLPRGEFEVPLILQDRTFNANGSLAYTMTDREGEDTPVVNGKAYPFLAVEQRRYRLRILNASNERFWQLRFDVDPRDALLEPPLPFWLIGTDGGFRTPLHMLDFLISPAERYDLIVDFSQVPMGTKVKLTNYPGTQAHFPGIPGCGPEIADIMQFEVTKPLSGGGDRTTPPEKLRLQAVAPIKPKPHTRRREWVVYQHELYRTMTFNAVPYMEPSQDFIKEGSTEIWEYINPNHDAHPMHVHLVNFQVLNRQPIDAAAYQKDYDKWIYGGRKPKDHPVLANYFTGPPIPPNPDETLSYKDTVKAPAQMVTRIIIQEFVPPKRDIASIPNSGAELPATYIHHCHLLEHEDDDLMRPWTIVGRDGDHHDSGHRGGGHGH